MLIYLEYKQAIYLNTQAYLWGKILVYLEYKQAIYLNTQAYLWGKISILEYKQAIYLNTQAFLWGKVLIYLECQQAIYLNTRAYLEYKQANYLNTRSFLEYKQAIYLNTRVYLVAYRRLSQGQVRYLPWRQSRRPPAPLTSLNGWTCWMLQCLTCPTDPQVWFVKGPGLLMILGQRRVRWRSCPIAPERDGSLEGGRWSRVNSRAASMIMLALHESVRSEMVARRLTGSTVSLLFRLMTLYQPGGEAERTRILHNLQCPGEETEPAKVVESNPDMGFRTNLVRSTLQVDMRPSYEIIDTYYKHLMAECEALAVSSSSLTTSVTHDNDYGVNTYHAGAEDWTNEDGAKDTESNGTN
eukprot:s250_g32.t1